MADATMDAPGNPAATRRPQAALAASSAASTSALGFGMTVAMWMLGYFCRLPRSGGAALVPGWFLLIGFLGCILGGGFLAGRYGRRGAREGLYAGLVCGLLNLMILGSLLAGPRPNEILRGAVWWVPGSILFCGLLAWIGGRFGAARPGRRRVHWMGAFAQVALAAVLLLLLAGGLVTSKEAGLAVVDWPNSFGYAMFLYPLSRMSGGIYYEHAHRLFGSLVGLTTLVLTFHLWRSDPRRSVRWFILAALLAVIVQGIMGGLRVTGRFTLSTSPDDVSPSTILAVVHGIFGQIVFGLLALVAVVTSATWHDSIAAARSPRRRTDCFLTTLLGGLLLAQLTVGALVRHLVAPKLLMFHISLATVLAVLAVLAGARAWGLYGQAFPILRRLGLGMIWLVLLQVLLGFLSLVVTGSRFDLEAWPDPTTAEVIITALHQTVGAVMLAWSIALALWVRRRPQILAPVQDPAAA